MVFDIFVPTKNRPLKVLSLFYASKTFSMLYVYFQEKITTHKNILTYLMIGSSAALIDISLFAFFYEFLNIQSGIATTISIFISTIYGFLMNIFFNFRTFDRLWIRFFSYASVSSIAILLSTISLFIFTERLSFDGTAVKVISLVPIVLIQYLLNRNYSFSTTEVWVKDKLLV